MIFFSHWHFGMQEDAMRKGFVENSIKVEESRKQ